MDPPCWASAHVALPIAGIDVEGIRMSEECYCDRFIIARGRRNVLG